MSFKLIVNDEEISNDDEFITSQFYYAVNSWEIRANK